MKLINNIKVKELNMLSDNNTKQPETSKSYLENHVQ